MPLSGVLNVYKEKGCTSFGVVAQLRRITGVKSIGHTGTLDPDAEGVLVVCIGKATKLAGELTDTDKAYRAVMLLGKRTDTQDISGRVIEEADMKSAGNFRSKAQIKEALLSFEGRISQIPPMYSALKVGGVKLVDAARRGREIERKPRSVSIYSIENIEYSEDPHEVRFDVSCSKGTYIRTLCEDTGKKLGLPACLKSLVRTKAAGFSVEDSLRIADIERLAGEGKLEERLIPVDMMLRSYDALIVRDEALKKLRNGNRLELCDAASADEPQSPASARGIFRMYDSAGNFYALYKRSEDPAGYRCEKMFI